MAIPSLLSFFPNPPLVARLFQQYRPYEILDRHKNKLTWQSLKSQKVQINILNERLAE